MRKEKKDGLVLWQFESFPLGQKHFVSGKEGGVSVGHLASLNLSYSAGDDPQNVLENRQRLAKAMEVEPESLIFVSQCHSTEHVILKEKSDVVLGQEADAIITNLPGLCICVMGADCVPIVVFDPIRRVVAAIHAGWRGTASGITLRTLKAMEEIFSCQPKDLWMGIGPSISQENYEVGEEVYEQFKLARPKEAELIFHYHAGKNKYYPNLWLANRLQARSQGVPEEQVETGGICTFSHSEDFFSARFFKNKTGRFAAGIKLN